MGPISGADETLVTYATHLKLAGYDVSVLLMYPYSADDPYYVRLRRAGIAVSSLASNSAGKSLQAGRRLAVSLAQKLPFSQRVLRRNAQRVRTSMAERYYSQCRDYLQRSGVDLVHVITPDPSAMVIIRAAHAEGIPVIYQELGTPYHPPDYESYYEQFTSVLPLCSEVAALSPYLAQQCLEQLPHSNPLSVLPIMVDWPRQRAARSPRPNVTFGFAARIEHLKGPLLLIDAFAAVCSENKATRLQMAGAGSQEQTVLSRAEELGITRSCLLSGVYTKPEQKSSFMRSLDVFVLPSRTEGTPNSIVEAMAHGLPVIASAVGGIPDVVTPETGILTPPGDVRALAGAMKRLASDPELRARMSAAAKERYEKLFSPKAVLPVMLETYQRVVVKSGALSKAETGNGQAHPWGYKFYSPEVEAL